MGTKEAMEILCTNKSKTGKINDSIVTITPLDIQINLECNNYELDLEFIQDLIYRDQDTGEFNMYQGHSLGEVDFD